jgi:hypothetical protein
MRKKQIDRQKIFPKTSQNFGEIYMRGDIYSRQKCPICFGRLVHDEKRDGCFCVEHPQIGATQFLSGLRKYLKISKIIQQRTNFCRGYGTNS